MIVSAFAAIFLTGTQAATLPPEIVTAADVVRMCQSRVARDQTYCLAYLSAVHDTAEDIRDATDVSPYYCLPADLTVYRLSVQVADYISRSRELWSQRPAGAVIYVISELYPCS